MGFRQARRFGRIATLMVLAGLGSAEAATAQATPKRCISSLQAESLVRYFLPTIVDTIGRRCRPRLGPQAYLQGVDRGLLPRLRSEAAGSWPQAKAALPALAPGDMPDFLTDEALQIVAETLVAGQTAQAVALGDCARADRVIAALSPLPAQNMAQLVTVMIELAGDDIKGLPVGICTPTATAPPAPDR